MIWPPLPRANTANRVRNKGGIGQGLPTSIEVCYICPCACCASLRRLSGAGRAGPPRSRPRAPAARARRGPGPPPGSYVRFRRYRYGLRRRRVPGIKDRVKSKKWPRERGLDRSLDDPRACTGCRVRLGSSQATARPTTHSRSSAPRTAARWSSASCLPRCRRALWNEPDLPTVAIMYPLARRGRRSTQARVRVHVIPKRLFIMSVTKQLSGLCIPLFVKRNDHPAPVTASADDCKDMNARRGHARDPAPHTQCKARRDRAREGPRRAEA